MLEDRVLHANRKLGLVSTLLISLPSPSFLHEFQEFDVPPEKIAITVPCAVGKIEQLLLFFFLEDV